jgi:hypothetical protein
MYQDGDVLVCQVGSTTLKYQFRAIDDLHEWLAEQGRFGPSDRLVRSKSFSYRTGGGFT